MSEEPPVHIQLALLDMRRALTHIEFETACAQREEQLGGWLSDHGGAIQQYNEEYANSRGVVTAYMQSL